MSKIFCEICGTAYAHTAKQCPICGCPKPESADFSLDTEEYAESETHSAPVKGGRFSKENVNKRLKSPEPVREEPAPRKKAPKKKKKASKAERSLIIAIICLLLAIVAVMAYILINYFVPRTPAGNGTSAPEETTDAPTETTAAPTTQPQTIPCTGLSLTEESIQFNEIGKTWLLSAVPAPADTTDTITYTSSDPEVATVSADGMVTAVGEGECTITITCGTVTVECQVLCQIPQPIEPTETEPEETKPKYTFKFATRFLDGVTLYVGDLWLAYEGEIDMADIQWSSDNTAIIRVKDGIVQAVAPGTTILRAVYAGEEFTLQITVLQAN